jgi:hypothetical protein
VSLIKFLHAREEPLRIRRCSQLAKWRIRLSVLVSKLFDSIAQFFKLHVKVMAAIPSFRKNLWPRHCLPSARELVRSIVVSSATPLSTKDIYNLALKQTAIQPVSNESPEHNVPKKEHPTIVRGITRQPSTRPPHPEHPVRSLQWVVIDIGYGRRTQSYITGI